NPKGAESPAATTTTRAAPSSAATNSSTEASVSAAVSRGRLRLNSSIALRSTPAGDSAEDEAEGVSASSRASATRICGYPSYPRVWAVRITVARPTPARSASSWAVHSTAAARSVATRSTTRRALGRSEGASAAIRVDTGVSAGPVHVTAACSFHDAAADRSGDQIEEHRHHDHYDQQHSDGVPLAEVGVVGEHTSDTAGAHQTQHRRGTDVDLEPVQREGHQRGCRSGPQRPPGDLGGGPARGTHGLRGALLGGFDRLVH